MNNEAGESAETPGGIDPILFEQYKLYVEIADRLRERRNVLHRFFIGINTAAVAAQALAHEHAWAIFFAGFFVNVAWYFMLAQHCLIARVKGAVINDLEQGLPTKPWTQERAWVRTASGRDISANTYTREFAPVGLEVIEILRNESWVFRMLPWRPEFTTVEGLFPFVAIAILGIAAKVLCG